MSGDVTAADGANIMTGGQHSGPGRGGGQAGGRRGQGDRGGHRPGEGLGIHMNINKRCTHPYRMARRCMYH